MNVINLILNDYTLQIVALGSGILGIISGILGSFAVVRKESLLGDAVSHAALPGIAIAFLLTKTKSTEILLLGALITGLLATFLIIIIERYSRIKFDSALALVLSSFFGIGMVLLTLIQKIPDSNQAGLESFIYGQASTLLQKDVWMMGILGVILIFLITLFWKELKLVSFDSEYADILGFSSKKITLLLSTMIVISIIIGLQTVGVILMSAMLVAPGVAARQWTDKFSVMVVLAAVIGAFSGVLGTIFSSMISNLPTGPTIVLIMSIIVIISMAFAPKRGLIWKYFRDRKNHKNINEEQLLSNLYDLAMNHENPYHSHDIFTIKPGKVKNKRVANFVRKQLESLEESKMVSKDYFDHWAITDKGMEHVENLFNLEEEED